MTSTLEELEGDAWPDPEFESHLVTTCHRLRKKCIQQFTSEDLRIMIGQNIGLPFLMPIALIVLERDPFAEGDFYPGDLLRNVTSAEKSYFDGAPEVLARLLSVANGAIDTLNSSQADADLLSHLRRFNEKYAT